MYIKFSLRGCLVFGMLIERLSMEGFTMSNSNVVSIYSVMDKRQLLRLNRLTALKWASVPKSLVQGACPRIARESEIEAVFRQN